MIKPVGLIRAYASLTIAHGGRFGVIDAMDPSGTLDERRWRMVGEVFREIEEYEEYLGTDIRQDIAISFSYDSKLDPGENGQRAPGFREHRRDILYPHKKAVLGATESLRTNHLPFGVICKKNLGQLSDHQILILPNLLRISNEEADAFRSYIDNGGIIYASKYTLHSHSTL